MCCSMTYITVTVCLFLIAVFNYSHRDIMCTNLPPGLSQMALGVDITTLDLFPIDKPNSQGMKSPILNFTCNRGRIWTSNNGKEYQYPDQLLSMSSHDEGWTPAEVNLFQSDNDVRKWMNRNVGGESFIFNFSFSGSHSYKNKQLTIINSSKYIEDVFSFRLLSKFSFVPAHDFHLGRFVKKYIDRYLSGTFESNRAAYEKFIRKFGTHYFSRANFGGIMRSYLETNKNYVKSKTGQEIVNDAKSLFIKATVSRSIYVSDSFQRSTSSIVRYYGGDTNVTLTNGTQQWQNTIENAPWLFSGQLKPIVDLISDTTKKENIVKAVDQHVMRSFLEELLRVVATERQVLGGYAILNSLKNRIEIMQRKEILIGNQVKALRKDINLHLTDLKNTISKHIKDLEELLGLVAWAKQRVNDPILDTLANRIEATKGTIPLVKNEIDILKSDVSYQLNVPSWFRDNTKLCYKWRPDGDGGQCGGGAARLLCSAPNARTPVYRDDTDGRGGGCRMQWGITSTSYPSWFAGVKVCYRWYPDGNGGQCGGGAGRLLCAPINQYTPEYRDDTDGRGGGCRMSWKLDVPSSAPLWLKTTKLCYYWYPDGDGGQCGPAASNTLCASNGQWTSYYRDDTDGRGGGCRMSWALSRLL